jgi:hypothetical protein
MPELEKIRLNSQKRQALKKEWANTVYNNMPLQVDEDLKEAQENYRTVRSDVWDNVITPNVEANFPMADMKILQKYSGRVVIIILLKAIVAFTLNPRLVMIARRNINGT